VYASVSRLNLVLASMVRCRPRHVKLQYVIWVVVSVDLEPN